MPILERNTRTRILSILRCLIEQPKIFTQCQSAKHFGFSEATLVEIFEIPGNFRSTTRGKLFLRYSD